ncbi:UvrD-helicase domain-containing protein [Bartonella sp. HY761]|uniref:UvrD-helicase domain-containing protein n=1 Tax=Bartonella sp. HY761 TaxID=2979330 RepID=UPI0021E2CB71|nr:UvrD-helicase domain-containing protein [Bartonella sp. HY761]UXN08069.1 AAA family ATPase [Bartonella sp. HY761]
MATDRLNIISDEDKILAIINDGKNFLLSGGAGSGKTYSLVQIIKTIITDKPQERIAVITYTNAATAEIKSRIDSPNLFISTIHEFLWNNIKSYQIQIKEALAALAKKEAIANATAEEGKEKKQFAGFDAHGLIEKSIQYKEYKSLKDGIISHDEVLAIANYLFENYKKLRLIVKDKYQYIFLDEYQDTSPLVVEILLTFLQQDNSKKNTIIGLFGDAMQSIYDGGVGTLDDSHNNSIKTYIDNNRIQKVDKVQNRRNPSLIYELANKLRLDGLKQTQSNDKNAPNMVDEKVKKGTIRFYFYVEPKNSTECKDDETREDPKSTNIATQALQKVKSQLGWDFTDAKNTKELNLTHKLIASQVGFELLLEIYDKNKILDYRDRIKEFIKDNPALNLDELGDTFGAVIEYLEKSYPEDANLQPKQGVEKTYIENHQYIFEFAKKQPIKTFFKTYVSKDNLISDLGDNEDGTHNAQSQRDPLINQLFKIQNLITLNDASNFSQFILKTDYEIIKRKDKKDLAKFITNLSSESGTQTIGEVIDEADKNLLCRKGDSFNNFVEKNPYIYGLVRDVPYNQFRNLYNYITGKTPFSTQHKTKGSEFNNVLVVLDNGNWPKYNFNTLFDKEKGKGLASAKKTKTAIIALERYHRVSNKTARIFYVCCTRAKENLACFYYNPSEQVLKTAKEWFGEENVIDVLTL